MTMTKESDYKEFLENSGWTFDPTKFNFSVSKVLYGNDYTWMASSLNSVYGYCRSIYNIRDKEYKFSVTHISKGGSFQASCNYIIPNSQVAESIFTVPFDEWYEEQVFISSLKNRRR